MCLFSFQLDKIEGVFERPNDDVIREISKALRQALGVSLFGIDIIINNQTGQHAVIDINAFPGKKGLSTPALWSNFFCCLISLLPRLGVGRQPPHSSEIKYRSVWEGKNPYLDMEFSSKVLALRRYDQILVASWSCCALLCKGKLKNCSVGLCLGTYPFWAQSSFWNEKNTKFYFSRTFKDYFFFFETLGH